MQNFCLRLRGARNSKADRLPDEDGDRVVEHGVDDRAEADEQNDAGHEAVRQLLRSEERAGHEERGNDDHLGRCVHERDNEVENRACNRLLNRVRVLLEVERADGRKDDVGAQ